MDVKEKIK